MRKVEARAFATRSGGAWKVGEGLAAKTEEGTGLKTHRYKAGEAKCQLHGAWWHETVGVSSYFSYSY